MTFLELQNRLMDRLNLSHETARARLKNHINERVRALQTSCSLGAVRWGTVTVLTVAEDPILELDGVALQRTLTIPAHGRALSQTTIDGLRVRDTTGTTRGIPHSYAVSRMGSEYVTVEFLPTPDAEYAVQVEGILAGVDLVDDSDVPVFPADFQDAIIYGVLADENQHFDKVDRFEYYERKFEKRRNEARYFISRQIYLHRVQNGLSFDFTSSSWWWLYGSPVVSP